MINYDKFDIIFNKNTQVVLMREFLAFWRSKRSPIINDSLVFQLLLIVKNAILFKA